MEIEQGFIYRFKKYMKKINLQHSLMIYMMIAVLASVICSIATWYLCESWANLIFSINRYESAGQIEEQLLMISNINKLTFPIFIVIALFISIKCYYRMNLKEPIQIVKNEMDCISRDDLSFDCSYDIGNEMGDICEGFNLMRLQLIENKTNMWNLMQSQRELNAAFAHEIRTPLTVMKGYSELLIKYYDTGNISADKLKETLEAIHFQVVRLEQFSSTMKDIHTFEELEVRRSRIDSQIVLNSIAKVINIHDTKDYQIKFQYPETIPEQIYCDNSIVIQVLDNLIANASRYVKNQITVMLEYEEQKLRVYVKDDGLGFVYSSIGKVTKPYYSTDANHYGLGLTICKMLCEKHGGRLEVSNGIETGAIVCATFFVG